MNARNLPNSAWRVHNISVSCIGCQAFDKFCSRMVQKLKSRGPTIVIIEHSAEPLVPSYSAVRRDRLHWNNETIVEPLMVPLQMIMRHELSESHFATRLHQRRSFAP